MRAIELRAEITNDHELRVKLPEDVASGPARVIVLLEEPEDVAKQVAAQKKMRAFFQRLDERQVNERSVDEIDRMLENERNSWY